MERPNHTRGLALALLAFAIIIMLGVTEATFHQATKEKLAQTEEQLDLSTTMTAYWILKYRQKDKELHFCQERKALLTTIVTQ